MLCLATEPWEKNLLKKSGKFNEYYILKKTLAVSWVFLDNPWSSLCGCLYIVIESVSTILLQSWGPYYNV